MRLTVNLDEDTGEDLADLANRLGVSKSQVVRDAVQHYYKLNTEWDGVDEDRLLWYVRLLGSKEHRIYDVDHIDSILSEVESFERLRSEWHRIGREHGVRWAGQFPTLEKKLRVLEYCNWYTISSVEDDQYTLIFSDDREPPLVAEFLRGECDELGIDVDLKQIDRKLIVTNHSE